MILSKTASANSEPALSPMVSPTSMGPFSANPGLNPMADKVKKLSHIKAFSDSARTDGRRGSHTRAHHPNLDEAGDRVLPDRKAATLQIL